MSEEVKINVDDNTSTESTEKKAPLNEEASVFKNEQEAKAFIGGFFDFLKGGDFQEKVEAMAKDTQLPKKIIAKNFAGKVLGTIADIFGLCVDTISDTVTTLINILARVLISGIELIMRVAKRLIAIITFNKTCKVN